MTVRCVPKNNTAIREGYRNDSTVRGPNHGSVIAEVKPCELDSRSTGRWLQYATGAPSLADEYPTRIVLGDVSSEEGSDLSGFGGVRRQIPKNEAMVIINL